MTAVETTNYTVDATTNLTDLDPSQYLITSVETPAGPLWACVCPELIHLAQGIYADPERLVRAPVMNSRQFPDYPMGDWWARVEANSPRPLARVNIGKYIPEAGTYKVSNELRSIGYIRANDLMNPTDLVFQPERLGGLRLETVKQAQAALMPILMLNIEGYI
jgi:hypothetical protein